MIFENGFIQEEKTHLLEENYRIKDLLNLSEQVETFYNKIQNIKGPAVIGLIGKLGSGKTNFINQIMDKKDLKFFLFNARKYPDRKNLWENLILEIAIQQNKKDFLKEVKKIDGKQYSSGKKLLEVLADLTGLKILKHFNYFMEKEPATRVFQLQEIFKKLIEKEKKQTIYIIVEDVDRAGIEGLFFLETLNYYIKETNIDKEIIVIALIGEENYEEEKTRLSLQKSLDFEYRFTIKNPGLEDFINELFVDKIIKDKDRRGQITSFLEGVFSSYRDQINMRVFKKCIRQANMNYKYLIENQKQGIDWRICLMIEFSKKIKKSKTNLSYFEMWKNNEEIKIEENSIFIGLINCIIQDNHRINEHPFDSIYGDKNNKKIREWNWRIEHIRIVRRDYKGINNVAGKDPIWLNQNDLYQENSYFSISYKYFE